MSCWSRLVNVIRGEQVNREIDEEFESHIEEAVARGRDPQEARGAFGSGLRRREESRDFRVAARLDALRADAVFGWRQLMKRKVSSAAAILSLGVAIGACTSAFRLIDALLLRPLPVAEPGRLYDLARQMTGFDGLPRTYDAWAYPAFRQMRAAVKNQAELMAVSYTEPADITYRSDEEMEKAQLQYVSGWMFRTFGLRPAAGRLLTESDDLTPKAHAYAVLSENYWARRFGRDSRAVGRKFRMGDELYQIIGVVEGPFTGTETGTVTDVFVPSMMNAAVTRNDATWHRTLAQLLPGVAAEPLRLRLDATSRAFEFERAKGFTGMARTSVERFLNQRLLLQPAASGASNLQTEYARSLQILGVLVVLVLLIACANVANLMTAQSASRAREMALRVSIGAGRGRLIQLVLVESAWLALLSAAAGAVFAAWAAPFVLRRIQAADQPASLALPADARVIAFGILLTLLVTLLFGLAPALRASLVNPSGVLKGGANPYARGRLMHGLISAQVAFCFLVLFVAALFVATFDRLSNKPLGFSTDRLITLETVAQRPQTSALWDQVTQHLRGLPGVESVSLADRALPVSSAWNGFVSVNGAPPGPVLAYFLAVSPGWFDTMGMRLRDGRDFRDSDIMPGSAVISETFARQFFPPGNAVGKFYLRGGNRFEVVGVVNDAPYRNLREAPLPVAYVPFHKAAASGQETLLVRTAAANPLALSAMLRNEVHRFRPEFRVSNVRTQRERVESQTVRERLLALLAVFFAAVALLLAGVGLYGVLDYSVLQRRREIGIRIAIGANRAAITRGVTARVLTAVTAGAAAGLCLGWGSARYLESLLYEVKSTDLRMVLLPGLCLAVVAFLAALRPVVRAMRTDPANILRTE